MARLAVIEKLGRLQEDARMRIETATLYHVSLQLKKPFVTGFGTIASRDILLVKVCSNGLAGWGEGPHLPAPIYLPEFLAGGKDLLSRHILPMIVGQELASPEQVCQCYSHFKGNCISKAAVETAVWDLFAIAQSKCLWKYLGATRNTSQLGASIGIVGEENVLAGIAAVQAAGYRRVKLKIKPGQDLQIVKLVRSCYPDLPLMVDCNSSYSLKDVDIFKALDSFGLLMIEQPFAYDDLIDHAKLQKQIDTPICLDESIRSAEDARKAVELGSCRVINIKPSRVGGIAESLKILSVCQEHGLSAWIGGQLESAVGKAMLGHMACLDGINMPVEVTPPSDYLTEDLAKLQPPVDGILSAGESPGIGIEIDHDILDRCTCSKVVIEP